MTNQHQTPPAENTNRHVVSVRGLDKAAVLASLWNATRPQGMGMIAAAMVPSFMTIEHARRHLEQMAASGGGFYVDYLHGRPLKIDLTGDFLDLTLYDRDAGAGVGEKAIDELRKLHNRLGLESGDLG